jgi:hypothetical protein
MILDRSSLPLPGFEDIVYEKARERARRIHDYLVDRSDRLEERCMLCESKPARYSQTRYVYETPWDDAPIEKIFCSDNCAETYLYEPPFAYFWCSLCEREICEQNPMNGWHIQHRTYDGEPVCLSCYRDLILENGVEIEKLAAGQIPGMFFNSGNTDAKAAGYREVPGFSNFFVSDRIQADAFCRKALDLMDADKKVIVGYERLALGGEEGYVTLMVKETDSDGNKPCRL